MVLKVRGTRLGVPTSYCQASTENLEETKYQQTLDLHPLFDCTAHNSRAVFILVLLLCFYTDVTWYEGGMREVNGVSSVL